MVSYLGRLAADSKRRSDMWDMIRPELSQTEKRLAGSSEYCARSLDSREPYP